MQGKARGVQESLNHAEDSFVAHGAGREQPRRRPHFPGLSAEAGSGQGVVVAARPLNVRQAGFIESGCAQFQRVFGTHGVGAEGLARPQPTGGGGEQLAVAAGVEQVAPA